MPLAQRRFRFGEVVHCRIQLTGRMFSGASVTSDGDGLTRIAHFLHRRCLAGGDEKHRREYDDPQKRGQARKKHYYSDYYYRLKATNCASTSSSNPPTTESEFSARMSLTIYHNPRCSKSRKTLELLEEAGVQANIVTYLDTPPDAERILTLAKLLGVPVKDIVRQGEAVVKDADDLPDLTDDAALAAWVAQHPQALQRPIVVTDAADRAVVGRPPENVLELIRS